MQNEYIRNTIKKNTGILKELEDYAEENNIPIIQPEVASLLLILARLVNAERVLEVGTAIGYSAILMSQALKQGGRIDTIEKYPVMIDRARENIDRAGLKNVINLIAGDAAEILPLLNCRYQLIFLDAAKGQYPEFLPHCLRLLGEGGLLVSDNILYKGMIANDKLVVRRKKTIVNRLRGYLDTICSMEELETSVLPVGDGVAVSFKLHKGMNGQ